MISLVNIVLSIDSCYLRFLRLLLLDVVKIGAPLSTFLEETVRMYEVMNECRNE